MATKPNFGYRTGLKTTNWKAILRRKRADDEIDTIVAKAWEEIVEESRKKTLEVIVQQLKAAWPRMSAK